MSSNTRKVAYDTIRSLTKSDKQRIEYGRFSLRDRERFWSKVDCTADCWLWTGARFARNGYGQVTGGQCAHRVAWELTNGPIPANQRVLHACDIPACVNPAHLFLGTHKDNMADAARKGRLSVARPKAQRVTDAQVSQIRDLAARGVRQVELARQFKVSEPFVSMVVRGKSRNKPAPRRRSA